MSNQNKWRDKVKPNRTVDLEATRKDALEKESATKLATKGYLKENDTSDIRQDDVQHTSTARQNDVQKIKKGKKADRPKKVRKTLYFTDEAKHALDILAPAGEQSRLIEILILEEYKKIRTAKKPSTGDR